MRLDIGLLCVLTSVPLAFADVKFTVPAAAASVPGGTLFKVTWVDSGLAPSISDLTSYTLVLYAGSNAAPVPLVTFPAGTVATGTTSVTVGVGVGGVTANAYFLGMTSVEANGGTVINYSSRFSLTGMTGSFTPEVITALGAVVGTNGPPTVNNPGAAVPAPQGSAAGGNFDIPYNLQTGLTKFAPMQPLPPNSITAQNTAPLWPTSSVVIATTFLPIPSIQTTITQAATWLFTSHANTAAAQSQPTGDMERFLNRWKD